MNLFYYFSAAADRYKMTSHRRGRRRAQGRAGSGRCSPTTTTGAGTSTGDLDIAEVPGDHHAMFYPENAPRLAEVLMEMLDRHERGTS